MRNAVGGLIMGFVIILAGGLLFIAVAKARERATRLQCTYNLKEIGSAVHGYGSDYGGRELLFPRAARRDSSLTVERRLSWLAEIGPYSLADPLWRRFEKEKGWDAEENRFAAFEEIRIFACPAYPDGPPDTVFVPTQYIGIAGLGRDAAEFPKDDARAGFFGYERKLTSGDISSKSTLMMAMEASHASGAWTAAGRPTVRGLEEGTPYLGIDGQFGGNHRGGANAVFADGSVRFLRESMEPGVLEAIATVKGSQGIRSID